MPDCLLVRMAKLLLAVFVWMLVPAAGAGQGARTVATDAMPFEYEAVSLDEGVEVDGVLSEGIWATAEVIALPYEIFPGTNSPAPVETECRIAYDDVALYVGCRAQDPEAGAIRAYISDRDQLDGQDVILLGLSPHADGRRAFLFRVNPLGVQGDAVYDEAREEPDPSWDAIWESAGRVVEDGYVVELGIPFRSLRFPERDGAQSWSFYLERFWPRQANVRMQSFYEAAGEACRLCQVNTLTGLAGISSGGALLVTPTLSAARVDSRPLGASGWSSDEPSPEVGLDVGWSVTSDVTVNATVNPDFSQVEADAAQLDANAQFALFFPERRPFFQEGADLFATPLNLAFTRTIVDPDFGGKSTGKVGPNAFGGLIARDRVTSILVPGPFGSSSAFMEEPLWTGLGTYRRDVTGTTTVGALVTAREGSGYHNRVASIDAFVRPLPALQLQLQIAGSSTEYPGIDAFAGQPGGAFGGTVLTARAMFDNRAWSGFVHFRRQDAGFRADAGFLPRTDLTQQGGALIRRWHGTSSSPISELEVAGGAWYDHTTSSRELLNRGVWFNTRLQGPWQSSIYVNPHVREERFDGRTFRLAVVRIGGSASPLRWLAFEAMGVMGDAVDYTNVRSARQLQVSPAVTLRPGRHFETRLSYALQRLDTRDGRRVLDASVAGARLVYNFSPRAFVRAILQHRVTDRDPATHADPVTPVRESALAQLLFSYKVNPRTVLFLGYSDDREGFTELDRRVPLTSTGRTLFLKVGYAFQP